MIQDKGPKTNIGFGIPMQTPREDSGPPSDASFIQKSLADKPVLSFLATGAASIISMHLAGRVVRQGGLRFGYKLGQLAKGESELAPIAKTAVNSIRQLRGYFDELEGVSRQLADPNDIEQLVKRESVVKAGRSRLKYSSEETHQVDNFFIRAGRIKDGDNVEAWTVRDSIQQRLVSQARRLPYELPAFYAADKAIITPLFNKDSSKKPVNWHNPVDVLGDFAYSSVKNLAFNVLPFDLAGGFAGGSYNKYMSQATSFFSGKGGDTTQGLGVLTLRSIMAQVGADAGEALNAVSRYSNQTAGAMSTFVRHSMDDGVTFNQWVKRTSAAANQNPAVGNANYAKRTFNIARAAVDKESRSMLLNAMPGPFKGMGDAVRASRQSFKQTGETYDLWQKVVSGRMKFSQLGEKQQDVRDFMLRGGRTRVEDYATQVYEMGRGGPSSKEFRSGTFYQNRSQDAYKRLLAHNLTEFGLDQDVAHKFTSSAALVKAYTPGSDLGGSLANRFRFTANEYTGSANSDEWWKSIQKTSKKAKLDLDGLDFGKFRSAVTRADATYSTNIYRKSLDDEITNQWNFIHGRILPRFGGDILTTNKRPFEEFEGSLKSSQRDFLVRRSAQRLGVTTTDRAGNLVPDKLLHEEIRKRGLDPTKLNTLRGYLIGKGDIAKPWSLKGANLFGFSNVSVAEAQHHGFFEANSKEVKNEIAHIVNNRQFGYQLPNTANALRMKGVYKTATGKVIDTGRITRGLSRALDTFADEYQTPLVHFNPLNLLGYGAARDLRRKAVIQYESGSSLQPFLEHGANPNADFHLWMKTSARGAKGKVVSITGGKGAITPQAYEYAGNYKAFATDPYGLLGRHARIASGDMGMQNSNHRASRWQRKADLSYDQSESLFSLAKRAKQYFNRDPAARQSPKRAAEYFARGADPGNFSAAEATGFANLKKSLRGYGFSKRLVNILSGESGFDQIFKRTINGKAIPISSISDAQLPEVVRGILREDLTGAATDLEKKSIVRNQSVIRNIIKKGLDNSDYYDRPTPQALRSVGVSRKIDELRNEFYKYSALQAEVGKGPRNFHSYIQDLLVKVESLSASGKIAKGEKAEARAAILGMQLEHFTNKAYRNIVEDQAGPLGAVPRDIAKEAVHLLRGEGPDAKKLLSEFASADPSNTGRLGFIKNLSRRRMGATPYDMGDQWNPFGGKTAFVPTFGTTLQRNPGRAIASVAGVNTWSDPQSFSAASVVPSHLVYRLNRYFETFHAGIDPTNYKGPLDFYARGMVGKRVLPIVAGATTVTMLDRQLGGMVHKDAQGNPVYSPLFMGAAADVIAQGQIGLAAAIPGGQTGEEKKYELKEGEVAIRSGRFWPLGNTPFKGGRIQYYRPSWYQRFKSGSSFIPEKNETPLERLMFGYDYSPLRPLDPYRFERENYSSRPYPVSGDYFTGPWGPLTSVLNQTVGRVLKPRKMMHEEEMKYGMQQFAPVGESGAYLSTSPITGVPSRYSRMTVTDKTNQIAGSYVSSGIGSGTPFYSNMGASPGRGAGSIAVRENASFLASQYTQASKQPGGYNSIWNSLVPYGVPTGPGQMQPRVIASAEPMSPGSAGFQSRKFGYQTQEMLGIYGFGAGSVRAALGMGTQDFTPSQAVLEPANRGYSSARSFWGMNLGGLGDLPLPIEGNFANLEISEIVRRFVPKEQSGINYINPLANTLGKQYPWLPGLNYPINPLKTGDPYGAMPDAEIRLPGTGYARTHKMFSDQFGSFGLANIHDVLADVAPWSQEYRAIDKFVDSSNLSEMEFAKIRQTRAQVESMRMKEEFTPYEYKYRDPLEVVDHPTKFAMGKAWEWLAHRDTYFNTKFLPVRTAVEDWERDNVYGSTFPTWQNPVESFLKPMVNKASQRNPILSALAMGTVGSLFGVTPKAKRFGSIIGGTLGFVASSAHRVREAVTGERFIPENRRKELALEEYSDILSYTRSVKLATQAAQSGDEAAVSYFVGQSKKTMYGVDLNATPEQIAMAIPKRKREHFRSMIYAPVEERAQILSTAGRLERRIYEAAWGMPVEQRPDIPEYFTKHELPAPESELWSPLLNMDTIKIKVGQSQGIDMSQMGYFPQQIKEANLINPSYPSLFANASQESVDAQLRRLIYNSQISGSVRAIPTPFPGSKVQLNVGVT